MYWMSDYHQIYHYSVTSCFIHLDVETLKPIVSELNTIEYPPNKIIIAYRLENGRGTTDELRMNARRVSMNT